MVCNVCGGDHRNAGNLCSRCAPAYRVEFTPFDASGKADYFSQVSMDFLPEDHASPRSTALRWASEMGRGISQVWRLRLENGTWVDDIQIA